MAIWSSEIKELEKLYESLKSHFPGLEKELEQLIKFDDPNVIMLYSRRCLEVIITDLCECELKRPRKTEPLKGIIDKLHKEEKVPSNIITSMDHLNSLSAYGTHPKDFDPEQLKPVLNNLNIIIKWYLRYKDFQIIGKPKSEGEKSKSRKQNIVKATKKEDKLTIDEIIEDTISYGDALKNVGGKSISTSNSFSENIFNQEIEKLNLNENLAEQIAFSQLLIKNDIIHITFKRSDKILNLMNDLSKRIPEDSDEIFNINQGGGEITIVCETSKESLFKHLLPEAIEIKRKTAIIRIQEAKEREIQPSIDVPGLYAFFIGLISNNNINILDLISTRTQLTVIVDEDDLMKAYLILNNSIKYFRNKVSNSN
jgi:hypothetical protein